VLSELGAGEIPGITVLNKIDKLEDSEQADSLLSLFPESIKISVKTGYALDELKNRITEKINAAFV
jgi:50S ribosomal subunit-associated GTPase HflX